MGISNDLFANVINTMKCLEQMEQIRKDTTDRIFYVIQEINTLNEIFEYYEELSYEEQQILKFQMKEQGKWFLQESWKLLNVLHKINELRKRLNNVFNG